MKVLVMLVIAVAVSCQQGGFPQPQDLIKDSPRLGKFIKCMQGKDTCEPWALVLREQLPEAIKTSCAKCNKSQKTFIRTVSLDLMKNHAEEYKIIEDYFDKDRVYEKSFDAFLHSSD